MSQPEILGDHKILLKTSSSLSKLELTEELPPLMCFLSKALNNYKITFEIKVVTQKILLMQLRVKLITRTQILYI